MRTRIIWLSGVGAGAAAAFLFDPISGNRRRRRIGDTAVHLTHLIGRTASTVSRDLTNRTRGIFAGARQHMSHEPVDDVVIEERVRAALGRIVRHPHAIAVTAHGGRVTLDGPVPPWAKRRLARIVGSLSGVKDVDMRFDTHLQPANERVPGGRPSGSRMSRRIDVFQRHWAPATRAIVAGSGTALVGIGAVRRDWKGLGLAAAGATLVARASANRPFREIVAAD